MELGMLRVRNPENVTDFVGPGGPDDYTATVAELWASGASRPEWCFVLEDGSGQVGRVGFRISPTTSDPRWLGSLPPDELSLFGLELPWDDGYLSLGRRLLGEAAAVVDGAVPEVLEVRIINELHDHSEARRHLAEGIGMTVFAEKQGFEWIDDGKPVAASERLEFRSVADIGLDAYRKLMAPCGSGTLDRNDRYYWEGCGADNWAAQMTVYLEEADMPMWLVGYCDTTAVGYIAVARDDDWGSTIVHVGVVPDQRGNGYIHDLLSAGTAAAQQAGLGAMLSDVDVLNRPMTNAMVRAGHRPDRRPWHVWAFRKEIRDLGSPR